MLNLSNNQFTIIIGFIDNSSCPITTVDAVPKNSIPTPARIGIIIVRIGLSRRASSRITYTPALFIYPLWVGMSQESGLRNTVSM